MNKTRYDLVPSHGIEEVCKVLTCKLNKYEQNEWKQGLKWTSVLSSLKRHLNAFEGGEDFTSDNLLHIAEVANNALILCEYYKVFPQGDDRVVAPVNRPKIALDIDGVIFDFDGEYQKRYNTTLNPYWNGNYQIKEHLEELKHDKEFWLNLPVLNRPSFEVDCYITSRLIPTEWTMESLQKHGLPCSPVYSIPFNASKLELLRELKIDLFVDDKWANFREATDNGIFCYLMDAPHNRHYNVGHRRIYNLDIPLK